MGEGRLVLFYIQVNELDQKILFIYIWEDFFDLIQFSGCLYSELAWEQLIQILYKIMFNFKNLID